MEFQLEGVLPQDVSTAEERSDELKEHVYGTSKLPSRRSVRGIAAAYTAASFSFCRRKDTFEFVKHLFAKIKSFKPSLRKVLRKPIKELAGQSGTFAVVTFTSRQAAAAARNCNIDGRGSSRWYTTKDLPVTPLSDAAPGDLKTCRNCCRPVTLSLSSR